MENYMFKKLLNEYFNSYVNTSEGQYCDVLHIIVALEYILNTPFEDIKDEVSNSKVTVTANQIKVYLDNLFEIENPEVKKRIEERKNQNVANKQIDLVNLSDDEIDRMSLSFSDDFTLDRYYFEPYTLEYFKKYVGIVRKKALLLLSIIEKIGNNDISLIESLLNDLDIEVIGGKISRIDVIRLLKPMVYNYYLLKEKLMFANDLKTYLTTKISKEGLYRQEINESEIYPTTEIQVKNLYYDYLPGNVCLSERQKHSLREEQHKSLVKSAKMLINLFD